MNIPLVPDLTVFGLEQRLVADEPISPVAPIVIGDRLSATQRATIVAALVPHWVAGARKDLTLGVAGWLAHHGTPERDAQAILGLVVAAAEDDSNLADIHRFIGGTYTRAQNGEVVAGWSLLRDPQRPLISAETATLLEQTLAGVGRGNQTDCSVNFTGDFAIRFQQLTDAYARLKDAYDTMRARAERLVREVAQRQRLTHHDAYRGHTQVVENMADWLATARPEPDGSIRLVKEAIAERSGCGAKTVNDTLAPALATGKLVQTTVTTYDEELRRPITRSYITMPGIERTDDRATNRANVRGLFLAAPNQKRVSANGFTNGGTRPNAGRPKKFCQDCGTMQPIQRTSKATAFLLDCGHTRYELGEPVAPTENAQVHSVWDQYRDRPLTMPDGKTGVLLMIGVTPEVDAGLAYVQVVGEPSVRRLTLDELDRVTDPRRGNQTDFSVNLGGDLTNPDMDWMDPEWREQMGGQTLNS